MRLIPAVAQKAFHCVALAYCYGEYLFVIRCCISRRQSYLRLLRETLHTCSSGRSAALPSP